MVMPEDFLEALQQDPAAHAFYATLKRQSQFAIYYRLHTARAPGNPAKANGGVIGAVGVRRLASASWGFSVSVGEQIGL